MSNRMKSLFDGCGAAAAVFLLCAVTPASADDVVDAAKAAVQKYAGPQTEWEGPTSAPAAAKGKSLVYLSGDETNDICREYGAYMKDAAEHLGWTVTVIDGKGTPTGWISGFEQGVALKPDGIALCADAKSLQAQIKDANGRGITVISFHGTSLPGPNDELGLFTNIQQDPREIGKAQADWIIADSNGKGRAVVTSHNEFAIAETKSKATEARLKECPGCEVLEYVSSPIAEVAQRQPQLVISWIQKYGTPLYVTAVADYTLDFQVPALRSAGVDPEDVKLVGADGQRSAYERIRSGEYQVVTVSEPVEMQAYQAVDEINRAIQGAPPSGFVQAPYLVTPDNVDAEGGDQNAFIPTNDYKKHYLELWSVSE